MADPFRVVKGTKVVRYAALEYRLRKPLAAGGPVSALLAAADFDDRGSMTKDSGRTYRAPAVPRAFAILERLAQAPDGLRLTELKEDLGLAKSTSFVLLTVLEDLGYLSRNDSGVYRMTGKLAELGFSAHGHRYLVDAARPTLVKLAADTQLTVHLAVLDHTDILYIDKVAQPGLVQFNTYVGKRTDAYLTAVGKALLAGLPSDEVANHVPPEAFRGLGTAPKDHQQLERQLQSVRANGYAVEDQEEVAGVRCLAAAVPHSSGTPWVAVGCIALASELGRDRIAPLAEYVRDAAAAIGDAIGEGLLSKRDA